MGAIGEVVFYPGVIRGKTGIDLILVVIITLAILTKLGISKLLGKLSLTLGIILGSCLCYFEYLESSNYPNYVFTSYHLPLSTLEILTGFWIGVYGIYKLIYLPNKNLYKFSAVAVVFISVTQIFQIVGMTTMFFITKNKPKETYYRQEMGSIYDFVMFMKNTIPGRQSLAIPKNRVPFRFTSKAEYLEYFLYPVKVYEVSDDFDPNKFDWVIKTAEKSPDSNLSATWPTIPIKNGKIICFNFKAYQVQTENCPWGLIKIGNK
jgi:hypothetical protein